MVAVVHQLEWLVALVAGLPLADANVAGRRLAWVLSHVSDDERAAVSHTLAVVRLRQRLFPGVEPLCAVGLAEELGPTQRATVLATIAMA